MEGKISLSLDAWTLSNSIAFLAIVAHYVTNKGELGKLSVTQSIFSTDSLDNIEELLIDFQKLIGSHSGENMAEVVWETLGVYGLKGGVR